jgi:DNA end-binding protein Ku
MRAIWNGALSFGLVNIPVRLYSASKERPLSFRLLDKKDHSPIGYKKVRRSDEKEVEQKDIVKGFEVEDGQFVIVEPDDFRKASPRKTQTIEIVQFADSGEVDPVYFDKPYYLEPDKKAQKAYGLLRDALRSVKKAGIARFVLREREHIGLVMPQGDVLLLQQLRYKDELRDTDDINAPTQAEYDKRELNLALALIENLTERFDPGRFHDTYSEELRKMIAAKAKGRRITVAEGEAPEATSTADILKALQKSLEAEPEPLSKPAKAKRKRHAAR